MSKERNDQFSDSYNGEAAAGTKEISKPAVLLEAAELQDGKASNKGQKQPGIHEQI